VKLLFVTNLCPHYRVKTFETLARRVATHFVFYSSGSERYWNRQLHGRQTGDFAHEYLDGFSVGPVRITPGLVARLWSTDADAVIKCVNGRFALPVTYLLCRLRRKPFVLWTGIWSHPRTPFHTLTFPLTRYLYRHADAVAVYGTHVRTYLIELGVAPERIFVAWHAADNAVYNQPVPPTALSELRRELALEARRVILYVGRLDAAKGLDHLIEACAQLSDLSVVLVLAGSGDAHASLLAQAKAAGLATRFVGPVPTQALYTYYALADAFVLPSITTARNKETWGLVVNEAMNQGVPVVTSAAVGAAAGGLVRDGDTGLVVPERDTAALAAALRRLLTEPGLAHRLGEAARQEVACWTNERMVEGFMAAADYAIRARPALGRDKGSQRAQPHL
jgi:glycosyltransferase involved in cell wall biosynthesis